MIIGITDQNECDFAVKFEDASRAKEVEECMGKGLDAWYCATNPEYYDGTDFTKDEIEGFYWSGYTEPTSELLNRKGIKHEIIDFRYDEHVADKIISR